MVKIRRQQVALPVKLPFADQLRGTVQREIQSLRSISRGPLGGLRRPIGTRHAKNQDAEQKRSRPFWML